MVRKLEKIMSILSKFKLFKSISDFFKKKTENESSKEEWKTIKGYDGKYLISSNGQVFNSETELMMKTYKKQDGYERVTLYDKYGKIKEYRIHRLVAQYFVENIENKKNVTHIDKNKNNNKASNLQWK